MNRSLSRRDRAQVCLEAGAAHMAQQSYAAAQAEFEKAVALHPPLAAAHLGLARASRNQSNWARAESSAQAALAADPRYPEAAHFLGALLVEQDRFSEALPFLQAAVEWAPHVAQHQRDLGVTQLFLGDVAAARDRLLKTIDLDVHSHEVLYTLIRLLQMNDGSPAAERLFALTQELSEHAGELPPAERAQVMFSLAKAHEDRAEYEAAARVLERANALKRASFAYDIGAAEARMRAIAEAFSAELMTGLAGKGLASERPIFIVGMPRSGSTLVEQILAAHPQVHGGGEMFHLPSIVAGSRGIGGVTFPAWVPTMNAVDCVSIGEAYLKLLPNGLPGQTRTTDKWLENFENLGLINLALPAAKIIHCQRDPRDQLFSCWSLLFSQSQEYAYDMAELRRYHRAYEALMAHWRAVLPPGAMLEVGYEQLIAAPEAGAQAILAHCGLEWDDHVLRFWEARRAVKSASMAQVREPMYDRSIGRWRPFSEHLALLFEDLPPT
jgi:Tfp pilus assembly protein PilF